MILYFNKQKKFSNWESGKNYTIQIIYYIQEIFYEESYFCDESSYNPHIASLYKENIESFIEEVRKSISINDKNKYETKDRSVFVFSEYNDSHKLIKDKIINSDNEVDMYDKIEEFKNWFANNFSEQIIKSQNQK